MTREDLDVIAETTAQAVARKLRPDDPAVNVCNMLVVWADRRPYQGQYIDICEIVQDARAVVREDVGHSEADSSQVPSRDGNAALQVCRELVEQYRSDEDVYIWDLYKKSLAALGMETPGDPTPDSASGACQSGNEGGDSSP